jgi:cytochrome c
MDSLGNNKIAGAVLTAGIAFWGLGLLADATVHPKKLEKSAIEIKGGEAPAAGAAVAAAPQVAPILALLIKADPAKGEAFTKKICVACHSFKEGGPNRVGPNLYGVVGRQQASAAGYSYSTALSAHKDKWTYVELNKWLSSPKTYAPGTKMGYAGITSDENRADVIAYLRSLSPTPEPLPTQAEADAEAAAAKKAAEATSAPAGGEATAAPEEPLPVLLAKATPEAGQAYTKKICVACHSFKEGGPNKVGPSLYGVVGRKQASAEGYTYSSALQAHTGVWTFDELNKWLTSPKAYAPGTKMSYAGIPSAQSRADVIDYLHTLSANPLPLPGAAPAKPEATAPASPQATPPAPTNGTPAPK